MNPANYSVISFPFLGLEMNPPRYFSIGSLDIHLYGVVIALGLFLAVLYAQKRCTSVGITPDDLMDGVLWITPFAIVCARIYYCAFTWESYRDNPISVLYIWNGGIAIYGAVIGAVIGVLIFCKIKKVNVFGILDLTLTGFLIGQCVGRWGNFFNREAFGSETTAFLRMGLTTASGTIYVHPTFLYESLWNFAGLLMLHFWSKKGKQKFDGQVFLLYVLWYGIGRGMIEGLRTDSLYIGSTDIRVSQLLAIVSAVAAAVLIVLLSRKPHTLYRNRIQPETTPDDSIEEH